MIHIDLRNKRGSAKEHSLVLSERKILEDNLTKKNKIIYILGTQAMMRAEEIEQTRFSWLEWVKFKENKILAINIPSFDRNARNKLKQFKTKNRTKRTTYIFNANFANYLYSWYENQEDGLMISRQAIWKRVKKWNKIINRQDNLLHPHALRSTGNNIWKFEYGFDDVFIQLCGGWKDLNTMVTHYRTLNKASGESYLVQQLSKMNEANRKKEREQE